MLFNSAWTFAWIGPLFVTYYLIDDCFNYVFKLFILQTFYHWHWHNNILHNVRPEVLAQMGALQFD